MRAPWAAGRSRALHDHKGVKCTGQRHSRQLVIVCSGGADGTPDKAALLARIAAAKAYKAGAAGSPVAPSPPQPSSSEPQAQPPATAGTPPSPQARERPREPAPLLPPPELLGGAADGGSPGFSAADRSPARPDFYSANFAADATSLLDTTPRREGAGSATEMASWMQGVYSEESGRLSQGLDAGTLRAEEFTAAREERLKAQGAEIITADPTYSPEGPSTVKYKPKVSTWGVFPRPQNISETYGGGRNLRPGQELETAEQKEKREVEYRAAMAAYRQAQGLNNVAPVDEAAAKEAYSEGMALFKEGRMREALPLFEKAMEIMPPRTRLGGLATLQVAMCFDTLGASAQAETLYKRIRSHPSTEVSKKSRQLAYGFEAARFLRTDRISYAADKRAYDPYFRRFADANQLYVAGEEERLRDEAMARLSTLLALGVVLGPVVLVAATAAMRVH